MYYPTPLRSSYSIVEPDGIYFLTATIIEWIPVFVIRDCCDIIIAALCYCRANKGLRVYAYVIMENHIHLVAEAAQLGRVMQDFKRHTAKEIARLAESQKKECFARDKGKEEQNTGLKRYRPQDYGVRTTRNPLRPLRRTGEGMARWGERQSVGLLIHEPPRSTRYVPDDGPAGSVTAPDG